ncbi:ATP-binding cassette domain-containing protein [Candidatus Bipolaricaulota bacterium]|nr:ATP-binding cassette domain-containing protein [Candidatus Bipolaricaulota bacterium]MBS3814462.1 ATP-binding cassette domain-containing protein [Candidatus Bipolaricaulota bacterium]MBS3826021.1 ATP-binding cassette domain-containing protein [Candidatus Bipolaricaulota bacterium]
MISILILRHVDVKYGDFSAVKDFSMETQLGEAVGITGKNGAGKTSLLRGIVGLAETTGELFLHDRNLSDYSQRSLASGVVGYLPQEKRVFSNLTALENLKIIPTNKLLATVKERVLSWFPELENHLDQRGASLSGGEQAMLALGRALVTEPDLLLLDEPTEGLMPELERRLLSVLKEERSAEACIVIAEQNLDFLEGLCSKAYYLEQGRTAETKEF